MPEDRVVDFVDQIEKSEWPLLVNGSLEERPREKSPVESSELQSGRIFGVGVDFVSLGVDRVDEMPRPVRRSFARS